MKLRVFMLGLLILVLIARGYVAHLQDQEVHEQAQHDAFRQKSQATASDDH